MGREEGREGLYLACCNALMLAGGNPGRLAGGAARSEPARIQTKRVKKKIIVCSQLARHKALCMRPASWPTRTASALTQCPVAVPRTSTRFARARRHRGKGEESTVLFKEGGRSKCSIRGKAGGRIGRGKDVGGIPACSS